MKGEIWEKTKKISIKLGHSELMATEVINNEIDNVQVNSDLLNVEFIDYRPFSKK